MKTIRRGDKVRRVQDETADLMVKNGGFKFVPKSTWKVIRDTEKEVITKDSGRTAPPPIKKSRKK